MLDFKPTLVATLNTLGVPVIHEYSIVNEVPFPCITFLESANNATLEGDSIYYGDILYTIKVWDKDQATQTTLTLAVNEKLRELGFKREFSADFPDCKILRYRGTTKINTIKEI